MTRYSLTLASSVLASLALCACTTRAVLVDTSSSSISSAVANADRPDADKTRDANRKPAETLAFLGIHPGEQVAELLPGGGYFTRLFSNAVGPTGHVYALVPERPANAPADMPDLAGPVKAIAANPAFANVTVVVQPINKLAAPTPVDLVFTSQNYHDLHNFPIDIAGFNKLVFNSLKPGGLYVVLDHSAQAGSGFRDTKTLHRIDSDALKQEVMAAGFEYVGTSSLLANAADPRTATVFDPSIRGKTDQFILKFQRPKK
jgi:predicted methyltransferase